MFNSKARSWGFIDSTVLLSIPSAIDSTKYFVLILISPTIYKIIIDMLQQLYMCPILIFF